MAQASTKKLTLPVMTKRLDELLKVVRYYGSADGVTNKCATCHNTFVIKELQCGHFIKRGNKFLKYNSVNLMPQCRRCNHFLDGAQDKAAYYILERYSLDTFRWLVETDWKWLRGEIESPKKDSIERSYNYWLSENRRIEEKWGIKLIPKSWEPSE